MYRSNALTLCLASRKTGEILKGVKYLANDIFPESFHEVSMEKSGSLFQ